MRAEFRQQRPPPDIASCYRISAGRIVRDSPTKEGGTAETPLALFCARIVEQTVHDDGTERHVRLALQGALADGTPLARAEIPAEEYAFMRWPVGLWGPRAVVLAGAATADHLRVAIQLLSGNVPIRIVYAHTGWREIGGAWLYLHAGGAIGAVGKADGIEVQLPDPLAPMELPVPPTGQDLMRAIRASLEILDVAPIHVTAPVMGLVYRAPLAPADYSGHLSGPTGAGKTELAALASQHWGAGLDARRLPGSWGSTGNSLEALAHAAKDALLTIDDLVPSGNAADNARLNREADRLLRAQGNRSGRGRCRTDGSLRPAHPPRGTILSTGEDTPRGQSLRARLLVLELAKDEMNWQRLTICQQAAAAGLFVQAMAGYVQWLAPQIASIREGLRAKAAEVRDRIRADGMHARTPSIIADLAIGWKYWLDYALAVGVVNAAERDELDQRSIAALMDAGSRQIEHVEAAEPTAYFQRLLAGALASGRAHVAGPDGLFPGEPSVWGWRRGDITNGPPWTAPTRRIGWLKGDQLYLEPQAAYAEAQELARHQGDGLAITVRTLWKRLHERGLLAEVDTRGGKTRYTVRVQLDGERREVISVPRDFLSSESVPSGKNGPLIDRNGPLPGDTQPQKTPGVAQPSGPNGPQNGEMGHSGHSGTERKAPGPENPNSKRRRGAI
jgi:hypothetical protein